MNRIRKIALMAVGDEAWIGGIQYIINILNGLNIAAEGQNLEVHIFKNASQQFNYLDKFKNIKIAVHEIEEVLPAFSHGRRITWFLQRKLMGRIYPRLENYLIRNNFDYVYPATLSNCNGKLNVGSWIADFQYHNFPDGHSAETTREAEQTISFIAKNMLKVIFSSRVCEAEGFNLFPVIKGKTHVMPFTVYIDEKQLQFNDFDSIRAEYGIEGPFIIVSNLFGAVKNHKTLFEALGILKKEGLKINLVCTGNFVNYAKMEFTNEILQIITKTGIRHQLYILGLIPRQHQLALYRMSMAMVQPSLHEGWSTCVEEARALGKTLILSDIEVHKEQYPTNPFFFEALNPESLAKKIKEVDEMQGAKLFPETEKEERAFLEYQKEVKKFGQNFLKIAQS